MKKIISLLLALVMICSLATVAFADETPAESETPKFTTEIVLNKLYTITGATGTNAADVFPHETLNFVSTPANTNPDPSMNLTIAPLPVSGPNGTMAITLPDYTTVGIYEYTITETAGSAQAAVYSDGAISVSVLVTYNANHTALVAEVILVEKTKEDDTQASVTDGKIDTFINTYDVGHLTVEKTISGNLASDTEYFDFTVEFTSAKQVMSDITVTGGSHADNAASIAWGNWTAPTAEGGNYTYTYTCKLKATDKLTFQNIPDGVTYTVNEDDRHEVVDPNGSNPATGYTVTGEVKGTEESPAQTITSGETSEVTVNNHKNELVPTGVILDSAPYFVMLAVAVFGMVALVSKKRYEV